MKRSLAISLCTLAVLHAHAQSSVTLYGNLDVGLQYVGNANAAHQAQWSLASGSYIPSFWGITGRENLGGGYAAFFKLENGYNINNGAVATTTSFFNRFSFVGLDTPAGQLTFGRQGSVQFDKTVGYDPFYYASISQLSLNAAPFAEFKINNMVKYRSASLAGFNMEAAYAFGQEIAGSNISGRYVGAALEYVQGPFSARILHEEQRGTITGSLDQSSLVDRRTSVAAVYQPSSFSLFADYTRVTGDLHLSPAGTIYTVGASYLPVPWLRFSGEAGLYHSSDHAGSPKLFNLMGQYFLSKSSFVYLIGGYLINSGGTSYGVIYPAVAAAPGLTQLGVTTGFEHRF